MLANLANIPRDEKSLTEWANSHMAHHRDIIRRIYETQRLVLAEYVLLPINPENPADWADQHQIMHNEMNAALSLQGNDLTAIDWNDQGVESSWIWLNFIEHQAAGTKLGV